MHQFVDVGFLRDMVIEVGSVIETFEREVQEFCVLPADAQRPAVLAESETVEIALFLGWGGDAEEDSKGTDKGEVVTGRGGPEGSEMSGTKSIDKVHRGDQTSFCCRAADMRKVGVRGVTVERSDDAPV